MVSLFSPAILDSKVVSAVSAKGIVLRPLHSSDYHKGFLQVLSQLTTVGSLSELQFLDQFHFMANRNDTYFTIVLEHRESGKIVAAGTILIESKFVHARGKVGHIEDIVVDKGQRGLNLGLHVIEALKGIGKRVGCYKVILDCSDKNVPFYEKCGFAKKEVEMAWYIPENDIPTQGKL